MKGKNFINRKPKNKRKPSDFYETPYCLTRELINTGVLEGCKTILDPCCGLHAISSQLEQAGFEVTAKDLIFGDDFLQSEPSHYDAIVMNPPFSRWDDFIFEAKKHTEKIIALGKLDFFGAQSRYTNHIWKGLKDVYIFTRKVDYQFPIDSSGNAGVGMLVTGWFVFEAGYFEAPRLHLMDINKYCTLGNYADFLANNPDSTQQVLEAAKKKKLL